jgi:HK97 family phage portal protein
MLLKGEGYFVICRDSLGRPNELWPVPIHWVYSTPYMGNPYYEFQFPQGQMMKVIADDMFVMKRLNPFDPTRRGVGISEQIADEVETDEYASKFQKRFFFNDATPSVIISMKDEVEDQRARFRSEWMEKFKGVNKSHGVAVVDGEVNVSKLGDSMTDIGMVGIREAMNKACREHFGVPAEIMGELGGSRQTAWNALIVYNDNVLGPRLMAREKAINQQLVSWYGDDLIWHFDKPKAKNEEFDSQNAFQGWSAQLITKNEARELLGMVPVPDGDTYNQNAGVSGEADSDGLKKNDSSNTANSGQKPKNSSSSILEMMNDTAFRKSIAI